MMIENDTKRETVSVVQGEFAVSRSPAVRMTTVLGSCIAACIFDPVAKIGGMNHFLLPEPVAGNSSGVKYGAFLMELLMNDLLKSGADRRHVRAKLYGGSKMNAAIGNVGERNIAFVRKYLQSEGIPIDGQDLGGSQSRRVTFAPTTGVVTLKVTKGYADEDLTTTRSRPSPRSDVVLF